MILSIDKVSKSYKKTLALSAFSYTFTPGIYALLGPNGSGKTTLMNIITDNLKPDEGTITCNGTDVASMKGDYLGMLGYMPQQTGIYPQFTAEEYLYYIAALKGIKQPEKQVKQILRDVELDSVANKKTSTFSGGMKQRLALAQAIIGDPKILVLDEPTAGLDPEQRMVVRNYISKNSIDKIVIIATHVVSDIEYIAKEAIFLKNGVIVEHGAPSILAEKTEGKVWTVCCDAEKVAVYQNQFRVTNIFSNGQHIYLRILSDERPSAEAQQATPTLEDEYFRVFA